MLLVQDMYCIHAWQEQHMKLLDELEAEELQVLYLISELT